MRKKILVLSSWFLLALSGIEGVLSSSWGQVPSLNLPPASTKPITVLFEEVVHYELLQLVNQTLQQTERVKPYQMRRAQKGLIEFTGSYWREPETLVEVLSRATSGRLRVESKIEEEGRLRIILRPYS